MKTYNCNRCGEPTFDLVTSEDTYYGIYCDNCDQAMDDAADDEAVVWK